MLCRSLLESRWFCWCWLCWSPIWWAVVVLKLVAMLACKKTRQVNDIKSKKLHTFSPAHTAHTTTHATTTTTPNTQRQNAKTISDKKNNRSLSCVVIGSNWIEPEETKMPKCASKPGYKPYPVHFGICAAKKQRPNFDTVKYRFSFVFLIESVLCRKHFTSRFTFPLFSPS